MKSPNVIAIEARLRKAEQDLTKATEKLQTLPAREAEIREQLRVRGTVERFEKELAVDRTDGPNTACLLVARRGSGGAVAFPPLPTEEHGGFRVGTAADLATHSEAERQERLRAIESRIGMLKDVRFTPLSFEERMDRARTDVKKARAEVEAAKAALGLAWADAAEAAGELDEVRAWLADAQKARDAAIQAATNAREAFIESDDGAPEWKALEAAERAARRAELVVEGARRRFEGARAPAGEKYARKVEAELAEAKRVADRAAAEQELEQARARAADAERRLAELAGAKAV